MRKWKGLNHGQRIKVMCKTGGRCWYCGAPANTVDHLFPLHPSPARKYIMRKAKIKFFPKDRANLLPACSDCNLDKGNCLLEEWRSRKAQRTGTPHRFWAENILGPSSVLVDILATM